MIVQVFLKNSGKDQQKRMEWICEINSENIEIKRDSWKHYSGKGKELLPWMRTKIWYKRKKRTETLLERVVTMLRDFVYLTYSIQQKKVIRSSGFPLFNDPQAQAQVNFEDYFVSRETNTVELEKKCLRKFMFWKISYKNGSSTKKIKNKTKQRKPGKRSLYQNTKETPFSWGSHYIQVFCWKERELGVS